MLYSLTGLDCAVLNSTVLYTLRSRVSTVQNSSRLRSTNIDAIQLCCTTVDCAEKVSTVLYRSLLCCSALDCAVQHLTVLYGLDCAVRLLTVLYRFRLCCTAVDCAVDSQFSNLH